VAAEPGLTERQREYAKKTSDAERSGEARSLPAAAERRLSVAWISLAAERIAPRLWPAMGFFFAFLALALTGLIVALPDWLHLGVGLGLLGATLFFLGRDFRDFAWPDRRDAIRRLETDSELRHRPLSTYHDSPNAALDGAAQRTLWQAHRRAMMRRIKNLRVRAPSMSWAARDPYALRVPLVLAVAFGLLIAGANWDNRLLSALKPGLFAPDLSGVTVDAWVTAPEYTGTAPIFLTGEAAQTRPAGKAITVPEGSVLTLRVSGLSREPVLRRGGERSETVFDLFGQGAYETKVTLDADEAVDLRYRGAGLGDWQFAVSPDAPPKVTMGDDPSTESLGALDFVFSVSDDYGVVEAEARITLVPDPEDAARWSESDAAGDTQEPGTQESPRGAGDGAGEVESAEGAVIAANGLPEGLPHPREPVVIALALPGERVAQADVRVTEQLADHPWAGREVLIQYVVRDDRGQTAFSRGAVVTMPERLFLDPMAKAVIEQRTTLATQPYSAKQVARTIEALILAPERFVGNATTYLLMNTAASRLARDPAAPGLREVYDLLWKTAQYIEDGDLATALERIRRIAKQLRQALSEGASDAEIRQLMDELRAAIDQYVAELAQNPSAAGEGDAQMEGADLDRLLDEILNMAETGSRESARNMVAQLERMLENLRVTQGQGGEGQQGSQSMTPQEQAQTEALNELADIIQRQRDLLDETFRAGGGQDAQQSPNRTVPSDMFRGGMDQRELEERFDELLKRREEGDDFLNRLPQEFRNAPESLPDTRPEEVPETEPLSPQEREQMDEFLNQQRFGDMEGLNRQDLGGLFSENERIDRFEPPDPGINGAPGRSDAREPGALAQDQDRLRSDLRQLLDRAAREGVRIPGPLNEAGEDMAAARDSLREGDTGAAQRSQQEALQKLSQGAQQMGQELLDSVQRRMGREGDRSARQEGRDPLGRRPGNEGYDFGDNVKVPEKSDLQRARELLDELRERLGDQSRDETELEYIERLLRRF